jgi:hypothetical protein
MIEILKAAFTAGEVKTFLIQGEYLEILEAAYPVDVAMMDRSGAQLSTMRSAEASYFSRPGKYEVIQVTSAQAQTVRLFVGSGDAGTRRTSGDVSVVDANKSRTIADRAFFAGSTANGDATNVGASYLYNPVGSGVNAIVNGLTASSTSAQLIYIATGLGVPVGNVFDAVSKLAGSATLAKVKKYESLLAAAAPAGTMAVASVQANGLFDLNLKEPIVMRPGSWLLVAGSVVNTQISVSRQFFEELI